MDTACALETQNLVPSTMNNWLGFSLSSYQDQNSLIPADLGFQYSDECFDLTPNSSIPPSIFEAAFDSNNLQSQDWSMRDESMNVSCFSCNTTPKLENFLEVGGLHDHNMNANMSNINMRKQAAVGGRQTLPLWMGSSRESEQKLQQSCVEVSGSGSGSGRGRGGANAIARKSMETFGQRTSIYRGVTRHRWTGRYEAHLWDNSSTREGQTRKGRQVYLGGYEKEEKAARSYDLAALKYWGPTTTTNFPIGNYEREMEEMKHMTRQEYVASLRRKSSGFSRGASIYRGVTRHHQHGRWQARIGRVAGNKDLYLGTFTTQEEAAEAYDVAAIKFRGLNAVTNFEINRYDVRSIMDSTNLPVAKRLTIKDQNAYVDYQQYCHTMPMWCKEEQGFFHEMQLANNQIMQPSMHNLTAPSTLFYNYDSTTCTDIAPTFTM